jgi:DNA polymerase-4
VRRREPLDAKNPIRALGVRAMDLVGVDEPVQLDVFGDQERRERLERLDAACDELRRRYGNTCVRRAVELGNPRMSGLDIKSDNVVHPVGFFAR